MLQLSLRVSKTATWLKTRGSVLIEAELQDPSGAEIPVATLLEQLFADAPGFIPEVRLDTENRQLEDLRGRPPESFEPGENHGTGSEEELFFGSGVLFDTDTNEPLKYSPTETPEVPFTVRLGTRFESFKDSTHIVHRVVHSTSPVLDEIRPDLSLRVLARLFPARLDRVRLGLESYEPRSGGSFFGTVPTVSDRLYLELSKKRIKLRASCDFRGKTARLPFPERGLLGLFGAALKRVGLHADFSEQLTAAL